MGKPREKHDGLAAHRAGVRGAWVCETGEVGLPGQRRRGGWGWRGWIASRLGEHGVAGTGQCLGLHRGIQAVAAHLVLAGHGGVGQITIEEILGRETDLANALVRSVLAMGPVGKTDGVLG